MHAFNPAEDLPPTRFLNEHIPDKLRHPSLQNPQFRRSIGGVTLFLANDFILPDSGDDLCVDSIDYHYSTGIIDQMVKDGKIKRSQINKAHSSARYHAGYRTDTAAYYEFYLQRVVNNRDLHLQHLIASISRTTGRPFFIYGTTIDVSEE